MTLGAQNAIIFVEGYICVTPFQRCFGARTLRAYFLIMREEASNSNHPRAPHGQRAAAAVLVRRPRVQPLNKEQALVERRATVARCPCFFLFTARCSALLVVASGPAVRRYMGPAHPYTCFFSHCFFRVFFPIYLEVKFIPVQQHSIWN